MKFDKQFVGLLTNEERAELKAALEQSETEPVMRVLPNGDKEWRLPNGKRHRTDGPAIEYADGDKFWYLNGQCHRTDGPAIERAYGYKAWWLNGQQVTEAEVMKNSCNGKIVEIEGKKYKLEEVR